MLGCSGRRHVDGNRARPLTPVVHEVTSVEKTTYSSIYNIFLWLGVDRLAELYYPAEFLVDY